MRRKHYITHLANIFEIFVGEESPTIPALPTHPFGTDALQRPLIIERMGICTEQAIKTRNLVKTAGLFAGGGGGGAGAVTGAGAAASATPGKNGDATLDTRACEKLRAAREHARLVEQHGEILVLSLRFAQLWFVCL